jgi:hypothetical protein
MSIGRLTFALGVSTSLALAQSPQLGDWGLDSSSGFIAQDSGPNARHGALLGFNADPTQWVAGRFGNALAFDGIDDRVDLPLGAGLPFFVGTGEAFSLCFWVRGAAADRDTVLALASSTSSLPLFAFNTGPTLAGASDKLELVVRNAQGIATTRRSSRVVFDGTWHHLAYVEAAGSARLYVDGVLDPASFDDRFGARGSRTAQYGQYPFNRLALGALVQNQASGHFAGALDEVQIYACALTAQDVAAIAAGARTNQFRPSLAEFGVGCGGGPLELAAQGSPVLGGDVGLLIHGGQPGALAALAIAAGPAQVQSLAALGLPGCTLYGTSPSLVPLGHLDAFGALATPRLAIPATINLLGASLVLQAASAGLGGIETSNAVVAVFGVRSPGAILETFANDAGLDREHSGGIWSGGNALGARFGGRGIHGEFDHRLGTLLPGTTNTFVFDTGNFTVPRARTLFGESDLQVSDGRFEFTSFVVPAGIRVLFRGPHPAVIRVLGAVRIDGELSVDGESPAANYVAGSTLPNVSVPGQLGALGGAGGGAGGKGADGCDGFGPQPRFLAQSGQDAQPTANSGYLPLVFGSGGRGGALYPQSGQDSSVLFSYFAVISGMLAGGGGGGSFLAQGTAGTVLNSFINTQPLDLGPSSAPGTLVPFVAAPLGVSSLDHFLVGGAGGGGGGSQPLNMLVSEITTGQRNWNAGAGGAGGGGALAFRVGHALAVGSNGVLAARGGGGVLSTNAANPSFGCASPGGGGSGGSIVVQLEDLSLLSQLGTIDISGGPASQQTTTRVSAQARSSGGAGGHGAVRLECAGPITTAALGTVLGPATPLPGFVGSLTAGEGDARSACISRWRSSALTTAPRWLHYRVRALVRGTPVIFSDDPNAFAPANLDSLPLRIRFQGGLVDGNGELVGAPGPWRDFVNGDGGRAGIQLDGATGFRFMLVFNRDVEQDLVIEDVDVFFDA